MDYVLEVVQTSRVMSVGNSLFYFLSKEVHMNTNNQTQYTVSSLSTWRSPDYISTTRENTRSFFENNYEQLCGLNISILRNTFPSISRKDLIDTFVYTSENLRTLLLELITVMEQCVEEPSDVVFNSLLHKLFSKDTLNTITEHPLNEVEPNITFLMTQFYLLDTMNRLLDDSGSPKNEDDHFGLERLIMTIISDSGQAIITEYPNDDLSDMSYSELLSFHYQNQIWKCLDKTSV
jgi:hypothetical protein